MKWNVPIGGRARERVRNESAGFRFTSVHSPSIACLHSSLHKWQQSRVCGLHRPWTHCSTCAGMRAPLPSARCCFPVSLGAGGQPPQAPGLAARTALLARSTGRPVAEGQLRPRGDVNRCKQAARRQQRAAAPDNNRLQRGPGARVVDEPALRAPAWRQGVIGCAGEHVEESTLLPVRVESMPMGILSAFISVLVQPPTARCCPCAWHRWTRGAPGQTAGPRAPPAQAQRKARIPECALCRQGDVRHARSQAPA